MGILDWLFGKEPDFEWHERQREQMHKVRERMERIDGAMERQNFKTVDRELREWRDDIESREEGRDNDDAM